MSMIKTLLNSCERLLLGTLISDIETGVEHLRSEHFKLTLSNIKRGNGLRLASGPVRANLQPITYLLYSLHNGYCFNFLPLTFFQWAFSGISYITLRIVQYLHFLNPNEDAANIKLHTKLDSLKRNKHHFLSTKRSVPRKNRNWNILFLWAG